MFNMIGIEQMKINFKVNKELYNIPINTLYQLIFLMRFVQVGPFLLLLNAKQKLFHVVKIINNFNGTRLLELLYRKTKFYTI